MELIYMSSDDEAREIFPWEKDSLEEREEKWRNFFKWLDDIGKDD